MSGKQPPRTLMADLGQYVNYPTFPGFGPWTTTIYERRLTDDYRIQDKNLPSANIAGRLDIFSAEYQFSEWLGIVVPLPSAIIANFGFLTAIVMRCSYWNWLNYGLSLHTSTLNSSGYSVPRPPTFHYQHGDKYKEVIHYGFEMILLGFVSPIGTINVLRVDSIIPFLEHRHQASFDPYLLQHGVITAQSMVSEDGIVNLRVKSDIGDDLQLEPKEDLTVIMKTYDFITEENGDRIVDTDTYLLKAIEEDGTMVLDISVYTEQIINGTFKSLVGRFFELDKVFQISDPAILYSEIKVDDTYRQESDLGYETREQSVSDSADTWDAIYYDATLLSQIYAERARQARKVVDSGSSDTRVVSEAQQDELKYSGYAAALASKEPVFGTLSAAGKGEVVEPDFTFEGDVAAVEAGTMVEVPNYGGGNISVNIDEVVIEAFRELKVSSVYVEMDIDGGTLSRHNFHAQTQHGNYLFSSPDGAAKNVYDILSHERNKIFLISMDSFTSTVEFLDLLESETLQNFSINSRKMWKIVDITTNKSGGTTSQPSLDRGIFDGEVEAVEINNVDRQGGNSYPDSIKERPVLKFRLSEGNYYSPEYLDTRFLTEDDPQNENIIGVWRKFNNWQFHKLDAEVNRSYEIVAIHPTNEDDLLEIVLEPIVGQNDLTVEDMAGYWWIGFDQIFPIKAPFNYVSVPFLGLNAVTAGSLTAPTLIFEGIYVGSPLLLNMPLGSVVSLVEDNPALFPNISGVDSSLIKVSTTKAFKYITFSDDVSADSEYVLYNRDDDASGALYIRQGRVDFMYDINEYMVFLSEFEDVDVETSNNGAEIQILNTAAFVDKDITSVIVTKSVPEEIPSLIDDRYRNTIWRVHHGDRLLGFKSTTGHENTIFTKEKSGGEEDALQIPCYQTSEYFTEGRPVEYKVAGNLSTNDPLVGNGSTMKFIPVLNGNEEHSKFASAKYRLVESNRVVRNATSYSVFPYIGGTRIVMLVQPQSAYAGSGSEIDRIEIVEGTESKRAQRNVVPDTDSIELLESGVFMMSTTDAFRSFVSGVFYRPDGGDDSGELKKSTLYKYPYLAAPNMSYCSYSLPGKSMDIAGFSKIRDESGSEVTCIVHRQLNLDAIFRMPVFAYYAGDDIAFISSNIETQNNLVVGNTSTDDITPPYIIDGLDIAPLAMASSPSVKIIIFENSPKLTYAISTSAGKSWSFYDDINISDEDVVATSPQARIYGSWLYLMYIADGTELRFKKLSLPKMVKFHKRYRKDLKSSDEVDEFVKNLKQELQEALDNTTDTKIVDTFDQQVSFAINRRGNLHVVFYDEDGLVHSAQSTTEGREWDLSPINF